MTTARELIEQVCEAVPSRRQSLSRAEEKDFVKAVNLIVKKFSRGNRVERPDERVWEILVESERDAKQLATALKREFRASNFTGRWRDQFGIKTEVRVTVDEPWTDTDYWSVIVEFYIGAW